MLLDTLDFTCVNYICNIMYIIDIYRIVFCPLILIYTYNI